MVVGETGQGREGRYSLTSTHHCSQIFTHRNSIASIPNSHLAFCGVSQQSVGGAEWGAEGSEGGHQGWRREGGEGILWKERDSATVCRRKGARVKRAWENAGRRRRGFDWNKGIWRSKNKCSGRGYGFFQRGRWLSGYLRGGEGLARVALIHLSAYTKTRIWSLYLLRPESCSLQLLSRPAEKYTSRNLASVHKAPKSHTRVKVKILC